MGTITSANSVLTLGMKNLFPLPQKIEGYSIDDAWMLQEVETGEHQMGIDGKLASGFTPYPVPLEINLLASSDSNLLFDALIEAERISKEKYELFGSLLVPSINRVAVMSVGYIGKVSLMSAAKKVLQPRKFEITFETVTIAPTA